MIEVKAPEYKEVDSNLPSIFTAGSIEMGKAMPWQDEIAKSLEDQDVVIYNPRRSDWNSDWKQDPTPGTQFYEQVTWELDHIGKADLIIFYFDPKTQSPITLLELGYVLGDGATNLIVCCPDGYFRKGNVVITCAREGVDVLNNINELKTEIFDFFGFTSV